jgi:hypothetical protein
VVIELLPGVTFYRRLVELVPFGMARETALGQHSSLRNRPSSVPARQLLFLLAALVLAVIIAVRHQGSIQPFSKAIRFKALNKAWTLGKNGVPL